MKTIKNYIVLVICFTVAVFSFSSCLNDDNDSSSSSLTKQEAASYLNAMAGTYSKAKGSILSADIYKAYADSADCSWTITAADSSMTLDFPVCVLKNMVMTDSTLMKALAKAPNTTITAKIAPQKYYSNAYGFDFLPINGLHFTLNYGGADHKVDVVFATFYQYTVGSLYSVGAFQSSNSKMFFYGLVYTMNLDGQEVALRNMPLTFKGGK
jgi:hypothetical protein